MSKNVIRRSLAVVGVAALALVVAADMAAAAATSAGGHDRRAPFATRAESLRLARRLLSKAVLPPGTRRLHGRKLPAGLSGPPQRPAATPQIDVHRLLRERWSMRRTANFLNHHHPPAWSYDGSGSSSQIVHGNKVITEADFEYVPRHIGAAFSEVEMLVTVAPARHGHALIRVDVQVVWYRHKPADAYLAARNFRAVRIDDYGNGPHSRHIERTFRQRAIIDKLTRVLNAEPVAPGGTWFCPLFGGPTVKLTFKPVKGRQGAVVTGYICPPGYHLSIGGHSRPALVDNGKIEKIADKLLRKQTPRGSHKPKR
jgi:hypothetical protein